MPNLEILDTTPPLQRPELNIQAVDMAAPTQVSAETFPWLNQGVLEVPTVHVLLADGTGFRYGSAVKGNHTVEKLANAVPLEQSKSAEEAMFKALPLLFAGQLPPNIDRVANYSSSSAVPLFKVSKKGPDAPRLYFTWAMDGEEPLVLKLATIQHKKQDELRALLTGSSTRRKHDGGGR